MHSLVFEFLPEIVVYHFEVLVEFEHPAVDSFETFVHVFDVEIKERGDERREHVEHLGFRVRGDHLELEEIQRGNKLVHPLHIPDTPIDSRPDIQHPVQHIKMFRRFVRIHPDSFNFLLEKIHHRMCSNTIQHNLVPQLFIEHILLDHGISS